MENFARGDKRMTYPEAAYEVLKMAGHPMHHRNIYEEVVRRGLWVSNANPQWVENSTYGTLIKAVQRGDMRLDRIDNGPLFFARTSP